ncbi:MAG: hypothetical protein ABIQ61_01355 [Ornithinibacter sp.]
MKLHPLAVAAAALGPAVTVAAASLGEKSAHGIVFVLRPLDL